MGIARAPSCAEPEREIPMQMPPLESRRDAVAASVNRMAGAARLTLAGTLSFLAVVLALHFLRRDYDPTRRFLSEFAVGPYGGLMTMAFFVLGLSAFALAFGFQQERQLSGRNWPGPLLFALCGADLFLVGLFPTDLQGAPVRTWVGILHDWVSTPPFLFLLAAMFSFCRHFKSDDRWRSLYLPTLALGLTTLFVRIITLLPFGPGWTGLTQRTLASLVLLWLLLLAARLHVVAKTAGH